MRGTADAAAIAKRTKAAEAEGTPAVSTNLTCMTRRKAKRGKEKTPSLGEHHTDSRKSAGGVVVGGV